MSFVDDSLAKERKGPVLPAKLVTGIAVVVMIVHAALPVNGEQKPDLVDRSIDLSGFSGQLERLGQVILSSIPDDAFGSDGARRRALQQLNKEVDKTVLKEIIREAVLEDLNKDLLEEVVEFYQSRLGREVSQLGKRAFSSWMLDKLEDDARAFDLLSKSRRLLIEEIVRATDAEEHNTQLLITAVYGLAEAPLRQVHSRDLPLREIRANLDRVAEKIRKDTKRNRQAVLEAYAHTMRSLNDEELKALIHFHDSPQGKWFGRCVQKGLDRCVFRTTAAIGEIMTGKTDTRNEREERE